MIMTFCPSCGSRQIRRIVEDIKTCADGQEISLESIPFRRCDVCEEEFFDSVSNRTIRSQRKEAISLVS